MNSFAHILPCLSWTLPASPRPHHNKLNTILLLNYLLKAFNVSPSLKMKFKYITHETPASKLPSSLPNSSQSQTTIHFSSCCLSNYRLLPSLKSKVTPHGHQHTELKGKGFFPLVEVLRDRPLSDKRFSPGLRTQLNTRTVKYFYNNTRFGHSNVPRT